MDNPFKAVADGAYDMYQSFTGGNTRAQQADIVAQKAALAAAEKGRADLAAKQRGLEVAGTDPASIQQHDNWKEWDHQRLATQLKESLKPDDIQASGRAWAKLGEEIAEVFADLDKQARDAAGDGMRGQAADAGLNAAQPLQQWGQSFGDSVRMTGLKVQEAGLAAEQTKASIQPPNEGGTARSLLAGGMGGMTGGGFAMMDAAMQMKERSEDEKRARAIAENVYSPGYTAVDGSTPSLPPPVDPLNPPPPPPPPPGRSNIPAGQDPSVSGQTPGRAFNPSGTTPGGSNPGGIGSGGGAPNLPSVDSPAGSGSQWADQPRTPAFPPNGPVPGGPGVPGSQPPGAFVTGPGPGGAPPPVAVRVRAAAVWGPVSALAPVAAPVSVRAVALEQAASARAPVLPVESGRRAPVARVAAVPAARWVAAPVPVVAVRPAMTWNTSVRAGSSKTRTSGPTGCPGPRRRSSVNELWSSPAASVGEDHAFHCY